MSETLWKTFGWSSRFPPSRTRFIRAVHGSLRSGSPAVGGNIGLSSKPTGLADGLGRKRLAALRLAALRPYYVGPPFPPRWRDSAYGQLGNRTSARHASPRAHVRVRNVTR